MKLLWRMQREISKDYEAGDMLRVDVTPKDFGRVAAQAAKQVLIQKPRSGKRIHI